MAGTLGRFRGRHGPGRGSPVDRGRTGSASGLERGAHDRAHAAVAGHGGSPPVGASAGRGGGLLSLRLTAMEAVGGSPTCDCWLRLSSSGPG
jgi:hypothetical protein